LPIINNSKGTHEKTKNDYLRNIKARYSIIIISGVALAVAFIIQGIHLGLGASNPLYVVTSESMLPNLSVGDIVVINRNIPFSSLNMGDIIVFTTPGMTTEGKHKTIVHRIFDIDTLGNHTTTLTTKGDANQMPIALMDYPIREHNYVGKVITTIPRIGLLGTWLR
jgi:signal peptidase